MKDPFSDIDKALGVFDPVETAIQQNNIVVSKKVIHDGSTFASGLEKYMYVALKKAGIKDYLEFAREALSNGDKILSENYFQYADHFLRVSLEQKEKDAS